MAQYTEPKQYTEVYIRQLDWEQKKFENDSIDFQQSIKIYAVTVTIIACLCLLAAKPVWLWCICQYIDGQWNK